MPPFDIDSELKCWTPCLKKLNGLKEKAMRRIRFTRNAIESTTTWLLLVESFKNIQTGTTFKDFIFKR